MTIIQIEPLESGQHPIQSQSHQRACWVEGYIEVPVHLEAAVWATYGWCDLQIEEGTGGHHTHQAAPEPEPEPEPSPLDRLGALEEALAQTDRNRYRAL